MANPIEEYMGHYNRGWKASADEGYGIGELEQADARGEPNAWYDGYDDYAASRRRENKDENTYSVRR